MTTHWTRLGVNVAVWVAAAFGFGCGSERSDAGVAEGALGADSDTAFSVSRSPNTVFQAGALSFDQLAVMTPAAGRAGAVRVELDFETQCAEMLSITLEHNGVSEKIMEGVGGCRTPSTPFSMTTNAFANVDQRGAWNLEIKNNGDSMTNRLFPATLRRWSLAGGTGATPPPTEPPPDNRNSGGTCPSHVESACASLRGGGLAVRCCYSQGWYCGYAGGRIQGQDWSPGVGCE